jgi:hypothetical protein
MIRRLNLNTEIVSSMSDDSLQQAKDIISYIKSTELEQPSVFKGIEEGEVIRFEWLKTSNHTVLVINENKTFYGYHLNIVLNEEKSFLGNIEEAKFFIKNYSTRSGVAK